MRVRLKIPLRMSISNATPRLPELTFDALPLTFRVGFEGDEPQRTTTNDNAESFFTMIRTLTIELTEQVAGDTIRNLLQDHRRLVDALTTTLNRVLRAIRNAGTVTHLREFSTEAQDPDDALEEWQVETSEEGNEWRRVVYRERGLEEVLMWQMMRENRHSRHSHLDASRWPMIVEAVEDNLPPRPEQEFVANSIEYFLDGNLRMSLIEAVVGLEIVLSEFIREDLASRGFARNRITDLLGPQLDLRTRLELLLPLILSPAEVDATNRGLVANAVSWRNKAVHLTGRLPEVPRAEVRARIDAVLSLVERLAMKVYQLKAAPEVTTIENAVAQQFGILSPTLRAFPNHRIHARFSFGPFAPVPAQGVLENVVRELSQRLQARDARFNATEHLTVTFGNFMRTFYIWTNGEFRVVEEPPPPLRFHLDIAEHDEGA